MQVQHKIDWVLIDPTKSFVVPEICGGLKSPKRQLCKFAEELLETHEFMTGIKDADGPRSVERDHEVLKLRF